MGRGALGKVYKDGETIVREGDKGACMYVIEEGAAEVTIRHGAGEIRMAELRKGDFFGEMALFDEERRSATVRARGEVRALTVDKRNLLRRIKEDPSLAFRIIDTLSHRIRELHHKVSDAVDQVPEAAPRPALPGPGASEAATA